MFLGGEKYLPTYLSCFNTTLITILVALKSLCSVSVFSLGMVPRSGRHWNRVRFHIDTIMAVHPMKRGNYLPGVAFYFPLMATHTGFSRCAWVLAKGCRPKDADVEVGHDLPGCVSAKFRDLLFTS